MLWAVKEKAKRRDRADSPAACPQSTVRQGASEGRACVPCHKVPVRLSQGALSWLAKNGAQVFSLLALANLYLARRTIASA